MRITVTRAFLIGGERQEVGSTVEVSDTFARELVQTGRATIQQAGAVARGPMTTHSSPAIVPGSPKSKGNQNARKSSAS